MFSIWLTLGVVFLAVLAMTLTRLGPDLILLGCLTILLIAGIIPVKAAVAGFSNEGLMTVGVLFVIAAGLEQTGAVGHVVQRILGLPQSRTAALLRMTFPIATISAFLNNTPIVALMMPVLGDWAKKIRMPVSQLMMPLSFATILGGLCTVLGTSTNIVVNGLIEAQGLPKLSLFAPGIVGVPCGIVGLIYIVLFSQKLLADRKPVMRQFDDPREYSVEMLVEPGSPLVDKSIEDAGLRHLPGVFLMEIDRGGRVLAAVSPQEILEANDRLVFVGVVESVVDLQKFTGLVPATNQVFKLDGSRSDRCLVEAVVSHTCPVVNQTIRDARFRSRYNAVVIAVARNGERLNGKVGDITVQSGDTLLLEADPTFADLQRNSRDFYLVSRIENSTPLRREKAWIAQLILVGLILLNAVAQWEILPSAMLAACMMILTGCVRVQEARASIEWSVLITIGAGIGIGEAMKPEYSGAGPFVANSLIQLAQGDAMMSLIIIYGITMVFTNLITAKAAATLIFPIAIATAVNLEVNPMPFAVAVMISAAASFATAIGYQTNLMVQGPGGYRTSDYFRFGAPLSLLVWFIAMLIIPRYWQF